MSRGEHVEYPEQYHLDGASDDLKSLYADLKDEARKLADFEISPKKTYIAFKAGKGNIFDLKFSKYKLKIYINLPKGRLSDPKEFARDVSDIGHKGAAIMSLPLQAKSRFPIFLGSSNNRWIIIIKPGFDPTKGGKMVCRFGLLWCWVVKYSSSEASSTQSCKPVFQCFEKVVF